MPPQQQHSIPQQRYAPAPRSFVPPQNAGQPQRFVQQTRPPVSAPSSSLPRAPYQQPTQQSTIPGRTGQQHLPEWYNNHQSMNLRQQQDALRREPGFNRLPQDQQQRLVNRLENLNEKTPEQRQRTFQRQEMFEHLAPERRQEVRGASQSLGQMPQGRQQAVRQAFKNLRAMPPAQRQQMLSSPQFASQYTPQERTVLGNLLSIEPYQQPQ